MPVLTSAVIDTVRSPNCGSDSITAGFLNRRGDQRRHLPETVQVQPTTPIHAVPNVPLASDTFVVNKVQSLQCVLGTLAYFIGDVQAFPGTLARRSKSRGSGTDRKRIMLVAARYQLPSVARTGRVRATLAQALAECHDGSRGLQEGRPCHGA